MWWFCAEWQLREAEVRFSEVFRLARESGPQWVTNLGRAAVVGLYMIKDVELSRERQPVRAT
jgi:hypothetical protein